MHSMGRGEFLCDLEAGVTAADDENGSLGNVARVPVARAVCLEQVRRELVADRRHARELEGTRGDDNLVGLDLPVLERDDEPSAVRIQRPHRALELDRQLEGGCVLLEIGDHFVARRVAVRVTREREAGEAVVAPRRE